MQQQLKPCPFCGSELDITDSDTFHPSGIGWKEHPRIGIRGYFNFREVPPEQWCYSINCPTTYGGCGAEISGDSIQETIDNWNRRTP